MDNRVTFITSCYENDWRIVLETPRLEQMIERNQFSFAQRILLINNVAEFSLVEKAAEQAVKTGIIDAFYRVEDIADQVLSKYDIKRESFQGGYCYSIQHLAGIFLCRTPYLLNYTADSILAKGSMWIPVAVECLQKRSDVVVINPIWNNNYLGVKEESQAEDEHFFFGYGFSDQCYLIRTTDFQLPIYNETNPASERYPKYGGELFEKRVDAWMRNHGCLRATIKSCSYIHKNFPKAAWKQKLWTWRERAQRALTGEVVGGKRDADH